jgi:hypothetical protein
VIVLRWFGYITSVATFLVFVYKTRLFFVLSKNGELKPAYRFTAAGFVAVFGYGQTGEHMMSARGTTGGRRKSSGIFFRDSRTSFLLGSDDDEDDSFVSMSSGRDRFSFVEMPGRTSILDSSDVASHILDLDAFEDNEKPHTRGSLDEGGSAIYAVLKDLDLLQYEENLISAGCITVESIAPLDYEDLVEECQMKKMHAKLLLKRARELGNF